MWPLWAATLTPKRWTAYGVTSLAALMTRAVRMAMGLGLAPLPRSLPWSAFTCSTFSHQAVWESVAGWDQQASVGGVRGCCNSMLACVLGVAYFSHSGNGFKGCERDAVCNHIPFQGLTSTNSCQDQPGTCQDQPGICQDQPGTCQDQPGSCYFRVPRM